MADVAEDILIIIFKIYLEEPFTMPISLTPVCRRWHNIIKTNPSLWSRIVITVRNNDSIPSMLSSTGFYNYISITDEVEVPDGVDINIPVHLQPLKVDRDIALDIQITLWDLSKNDHHTICLQRYSKCLIAFDCKTVDMRQEQFNSLLAVLAGFDPSTSKGGRYSPSNFGSLGHYKASSASPGSRMRRWRSLLIQSYSTELRPMRPSIPNWFHNQIYSAPRLRELCLRNVLSYYIPHDRFAPSVNSLTLEDITTRRYQTVISITKIPGLQILNLKYRIHTALLLLLQDVCLVEELNVKLAITNYYYGYISADIKFPNLKSLILEDKLDEEFLLCLNNDFKGSNRRLEIVCLINVDLSDLPRRPSSVEILTNARKIVFEIRSKRKYNALIDQDREREDHSNIKVKNEVHSNTHASSTSSSPPTDTFELQEHKFPSELDYVARFLALCASDTEIMTLDKTSSRMLVAAREIGERNNRE